jgi:hypothetical protein
MPPVSSRLHLPTCPGSIGVGAQRARIAVFVATALALGCNQGARPSAAGQTLPSMNVPPGELALGPTVAPSGLGTNVVVAASSSAAASLEAPPAGEAQAGGVGDKPRVSLAAFGGELRAGVSVGAGRAPGVRIEIVRDTNVVFRIDGLEALTGSGALPSDFNVCDTWDVDARPLTLFGAEAARVSLVCTMGADSLTVREFAVILAKEGGGAAAVWSGPGDVFHSEMDQCVITTRVDFTSEGPSTIVRRARSEAHWTPQGLPTPKRYDCKAPPPSVTKHAKRGPR